MIAPGEGESGNERMAEVAIAGIQDWQGRVVRYEPAFSPVVSPIHLAVESACFRVTVDDENFFLKVRQPDMTCFFDDHTVAVNNRLAGEIGCAPKIRYSDPGHGLIVMDRLGDNWRWARVDDLAEPDRLEAILEAKKSLHDSPAFQGERSVFEIIERYWSMVLAQGVTLPGDVGGLKKQIGKIDSAIAASGVDLRPCHGDGVASNIMIGPSNAIQLVDFDMAGNLDPYFDLGSLMVEAAQFDQDARQILEIYEGRVVESHYNRCRLYGIADDFMWALWGFLSFRLSPRRQIEFTKYAEWRLLRCRWHLAHSAFPRWFARL